MSKYAVIGLARTGISVCEFLAKNGLEVIGIDTTTDQQKHSTIQQVLPSCKLLLGNEYQLIDLASYTCVMSPGIPEGSSIYQKILSDGAEIISDLDIFNQFNQKPILAITGTNGKTSSVEMLHHILSKNSISSMIGANHGTGVLSLLANESCEVNILELSSFQLNITHRLDILGASILNISSNHIDRHQTFANYLSAKKTIYRSAKTAVINLDEPLTHPDSRLELTRVFIGKDNRSGLGFHSRQGQILITNNGVSIIRADEVGLHGVHNVKNFLVATSLANLMGITINDALGSISSFKTSPNRLEYVRDSYINDSKSTTIASTIAGIESIAPTQKIILMLGGDSKNADISAIRPYLPRLNHIVCFGRDAGRFFAECSHHCPSTLIEDIEKAITFAINITKQADGILLFSPAGTSLDRFSSYDERGKFFKEMVANYV